MWEIVGALVICYVGYVIINIIAGFIYDRWR